jgi:hypothetical protein
LIHITLSGGIGASISLNSADEQQGNQGKQQTGGHY